eukprot:6474346-Amphidinium_carterae.2
MSNFIRSAINGCARGGHALGVLRLCQRMQRLVPPYEAEDSMLAVDVLHCHAYLPHASERAYRRIVREQTESHLKDLQLISPLFSAANRIGLERHFGHSPQLSCPTTTHDTTLRDVSITISAERDRTLCKKGSSSGKHGVQHFPQSEKVLHKNVNVTATGSTVCLNKNVLNKMGD